MKISAFDWAVVALGFLLGLLVSGAKFPVELWCLPLAVYQLKRGLPSKRGDRR